jgi:integrase
MPSGAGVIEYRGKRGVVWRIKYTDGDGRQVMETLGPARDGWNRKKAEAELRERLVKVERKGWRKPAPLTFREYAERWLVECETRRSWRKATVTAYRATLSRLLKAVGDRPLAAVRPSHVAAYSAEQSATLHPTTVGNDISLLHDIFKTAKREELVDSNPVEGAERPKVTRKRGRILQPEEIALVYRSFVDEQARTIFLMLVLTGIRRHELQQLRWRDVDLVDGILRVTGSKTDEGIRSIALSPALVAALVEHLERTNYKGDDELVFCHPEIGSRYREHIFAEHFRKALRAAGITDYVRPFHDLRHTSLTNEAAAGSGPIALMAKAGHTNMKVTRQYLHLAGTVFRDEAAALERRLGFGPVETSTRLSAPEPVEHDPAGLNT